MLDPIRAKQPQQSVRFNIPMLPAPNAEAGLTIYNIASRSSSHQQADPMLLLDAILGSCRASVRGCMFNSVEFF